MSENNTASGVVLPYEQAAMRGDEMPGGLDYPDQVMYLSLRMLYAQTRMKVIDRDTAIREKKKLLDEYRAYKFHWESGSRWAQIINATELARAAFRKDPTVEKGHKLLAALEGCTK